MTFVSKLVEKGSSHHVSSAIPQYTCTRFDATITYSPHTAAITVHRETALLKVLSDIYAAVDSQQVVLLGLLDLSAAFDHEVLLRRVRVRFGIC